MKLYATITSERASKGQGGNKFIRAEFKVGSAEASESKLVVLLQVDGKGWLCSVYGLPDENGKPTEYEIAGLLPQTKGKQEKGDGNYESIYANIKEPK